MTHKWILRESRGSTRCFTCERCGAGPVHKDIFTSKGSINSYAKKFGIDPNCKMELVRRVTES